MAKGNESASFAIELDGASAKAGAKDAADAMAQLRDRVKDSLQSVREMNGSLKNLRGESEAVAKAKEDLKARILAERQAIASATLESLRLEKQFGKLTTATKTNADAGKKQSDTLTDLKERLSLLGQEAAPVVEGLSLIAGAVAAVVVAVGAVAAAIGAAVYKFGDFVLHAGDAARSARILRDAAMGGNERWGQAFGEQIDALSKQVPTSRAELDKLGISLTKQGIYGQTWVDSMHAVAQASAALGGDAASKLESFIARGQQFQRFHLDPRELLGTGVSFNEVASALATSMSIGVKDAQAALVDGRLKLGDGAAALRAAVDAKFGSINLRQMMSLETLTRKLGEAFDDLTRGVNIEPLLRSMKDLASVLDLSTVSGDALKTIVSVFGNDLAGGVATATPVLKRLIYDAIIGAQDITISYLKVRNWFLHLGDNEVVKAFATANNAAQLVKLTLDGIAASAALAFAPLTGFGLVLGRASAMGDDLAGMDMKGTGAQVIEGLILGMNGRAPDLHKTVKALATDTKTTFADELEIHSPSRVFAEYGENTVAGYEEGVERASGGAQDAVAGMVGAPVGSGGSRGGVTLTVPVTIYAQAGAADVAGQIASEAVLGQITQSLMNALRSAGIAAPA